jgi:glucokinase
MALLGFDLGGTKLSVGVFTKEGEMVAKEKIALENRAGNEIAELIIKYVKFFSASHTVRSIGIAVPGISYAAKGTVWAPNIPGWSNFPLLQIVRESAENIPVKIDNDRACCMLGERWKGSATNCKNAIFLAVGTGIGAGIMTDGNILRGTDDIAGAIGWMGLSRPFHDKYINCGCFEYYASGDGISKVALELLENDATYSGELKSILSGKISAQDVFVAYDNGDRIAAKVLNQCIEFWGMAVANLVSLFNPEKIIFGGGVFGPADRFLPDIHREAAKWAQPISIKKVQLEKSMLEGNAGLFGAGFLALKNLE